MLTTAHSARRARPYALLVSRDWQAWHDAYEVEDHPLQARLAAVVALLTGAIDAAPPGPLRLASLCAGDGRDVVRALGDHPRRSDVQVRLVELDAGLADRARAGLAEAGISGSVVVDDAGHSSVLADVAPVDLLLLCGIFGNVADDDVRRTVAAVPTLCRSGAVVLWTRHRRTPDLTPTIRRWFDAAGCTSISLRTEGTGLHGWAVGAERLGPATPHRPDRLFTFRDDLW